MKSVSALWAVAPQPMAAQIEEAHNAAVADALAYLEQRVLYSRRGAGGVRQVEVTGLIAAAFTHRDSRAGDPNLHTHVAIANKVKTLDGAWLAIDGRPLYAGMVSVSEVYNTAVEAHLVARLGLRFAAQPHKDPAKRGTREIVGVPTRMREAWSSRRAAIETRQAELAVAFQTDHGRPPTPVEAIKLAQQATLETRQAKHEARSLDQQRTTWRTEADVVLGPGGVSRVLLDVHAAAHGPRPPVTTQWVERVAEQVVTTMGLTRASWTVWHLRAEASRRARERATSPDHAARLTADILHAAIEACVTVDAWNDPIQEPTVLRRSTGESMYNKVGTQRYTSPAVLDSEQQILTATARADGRTASDTDVAIALLAATASGVTLTEGQTELVRQMVTSGRRVQLALAAAGSGKTTALATLASAWRESDGTIIGLAPSAVAARQLADQIGHATTLAKLAFDIGHRPEDAALLIGPETLIIIDEAGMADTPTLATVIDYAISRGASVRLIGDDQQLAAIGAGGILRDIADSHGAVHLTEILRFTDPIEAAASLALRDGRIEALGYHLDHNRLHPGTSHTILDNALKAWIQDQEAGRDSIMLAGSHEHVTALNAKAREHLLTAGNRPSGPAVELRDGTSAGVADIIVTRTNDRWLTVSATDWVKNGDRWTVTGLTPAGGIHARHRHTGLRVLLPADYVRDHVQLGYAVTVHGAQGLTVDTCHTIISGTETRQQLYVAMTRGRHANHAYIQTVDGASENAPIHPATLRPTTVVDVLEGVLARDGSATSAATQTRQSHDPYNRLGIAAARYTDALTAAIEYLNPDAVSDLDQSADQIVAGLTSCLAWPTLRDDLLRLASEADTPPLRLLRDVAAAREVASADDPAAVLAWRLPRHTGEGPLPWLAAIPRHVAADDQWSLYLAARFMQVRTVADEVRATASVDHPVWAPPGQTVPAGVSADIEVWRAAWQVDPSDRRPTGPPRLGRAAQDHQQRLMDRLEPADPAAAWIRALQEIRPDLPGDPNSADLARRLATWHDTGVPVTRFLAAAVADGPLPAEQAVAALRWRLTRRVLARERALLASATPGTQDQLSTSHRYVPRPPTRNREPAGPAR